MNGGQYLGGTHGPGPVVPDFDDDPPATMLGGKPDRSFFALPGGQPIRRRFDAVVDRITDDVR